MTLDNFGKLLLYITVLLKMFRGMFCNEIEIKNTGVGYVNEGDIAMLFYVTLENKCKKDFEITLDMVHCCETTDPSEVECDHMTLIGGYMGILSATTSKNITLIYPNLYLTNRQGICTVSVTYRSEFKKREIIQEIRYDTSKYCTAEKKCDTIDLNPSASCNPVDCLIKYSGEKSYFNPKCRTCKIAPCCISKSTGCMPDNIYSPFSNRCTLLEKSISKEELESIENNHTEATCNQNVMGNLICHNGDFKEGECICHEGWSTTTYDEEIYQPSLAQYHMCNIQQGNWNCMNKSKVKLTVILIIIFAITIASKILLLMCLLNWCYNHFHKEPKACARQVNSDDDSVVLCEAFDSYDKCFCQEEKKPSQQRVSNLQAQTVSVTYHRCCPSTLSSVRDSTGKSTTSTKCSRRSKNTTLTNTNSSSIAISFQSGSEESTEHGMTGEEDVEVEEDYEIEFIDEEEEDDMDRLSVEEDQPPPSAKSSRSRSEHLEVMPPHPPTDEMSPSQSEHSQGSGIEMAASSKSGEPSQIQEDTEEPSKSNTELN